MTLKAWLTGHEFDLQTLAEMFPTGDAVVAKDGDRYYLSSPKLDSYQGDIDIGRLHDSAQRLLTLLCGLARAADSDFRNVNLAGNYQRGDHTHIVRLTDTVEIRAHVSASGVVVGGPPADSEPPSIKHLAGAQGNTDATEALEILAVEPTNWVRLYKVYEIIRDAGALEPARQAVGTSNNELERFTRTANHQQASGSEARHARLNADPPRNPMSIEQARDLIGQLLIAWLDSM